MMELIMMAMVKRIMDETNNAPAQRITTRAANQTRDGRESAHLFIF
jgi:hypothetical protein